MQQFWVERADTAMGGHLGCRVVWHQALSTRQRDEASALLGVICARIQAWSGIATRHHESQLTRLNASAATSIRVGPMISALLAWAADAWELSGGLVNITMLNERIAAERGGVYASETTTERAWNLQLRSLHHHEHSHLLGGTLERALGLQFDLDGVGKGWIVDRAAALLERTLDTAVAAGRLPEWSSCFINGDGDLAVRNRAGAQTEISIEIPRDEERAIGSLMVSGPACGVATSGTGVHHWGGRHHLIDPRTGLSAQSGIAQATVVATSAREAEAWAKSIVIDGAAAIRRAEAAGVEQIVAVRDGGEIISAPALPPLRVHTRFAPAPTTVVAQGTQR